ncbi:MAG: FkbM family methyltransferase [Candidatus Omnitrophica bacterium]|nr:FkbM family methyltransferase [Candidatus Omnitrophota bacterium]
MPSIIDSLKSITLLPQECVIALFGAGERGTLFQKMLALARPDITVACFLDSHKEGMLGTIPIISYKEFCTCSIAIDMIIITSLHWHEIEEILRESPIPTSRADIEYLRYTCMGHQKIGPRIEDQFRPGESDGLRDKVSYVLDHLADNRSRDLYRLLLAKRGWRDFPLKEMLFSLPEQQYLDHINKVAIATVIEGGVYDGRATYSFLQHFPRLKNIYGFEPCFNAYKNGIYYEALQASQVVSVSDKGLWDNAGTVCFERNEYCSKIIPEGEEHVSVTTIDDFTRANIHIDYIKLDVEGAERNVLRGAERTLHKDRPQLAISMYHSAHDMIEIPYYLLHALSGYDFYIDHYSPNVIETILYAIPTELQ